MASVGIVPIPGPFPQISADFIQAISVGGKRTDRDGGPVQGLVKISPRGGGRFAPGVFRTDQSSPCRHFPFRLGGQAVSIGIPANIIIGQIDLSGTVYHGAVIIGVIAWRVTIPFGQGIGPFHTVVPIDGMDGIFRPFGNSGIGKVIPIGNRPGIDFVPKGLGDFVLIDGKGGGEGNLVTGAPAEFLIR